MKTLGSVSYDVRTMKTLTTALHEVWTLQKLCTVLRQVRTLDTELYRVIVQTPYTVMPYAKTLQTLWSALFGVSNFQTQSSVVYDVRSP